MNEDPKICPGCKNEIDPDTCGCGGDREHHNDFEEGHAFVPAGCACYYCDAQEILP